MNAQQLEWNDLHLVLAICRAGTLSGAARTLGINHSTVYRRVVTIEKKMGVRLFERLSTGYIMTKAGEAMLATGEKVEAEINGLSLQLLGRDLQLFGSLIITVPDALGLNLLLPHINEFCKRYPKINIDFSVSNDSLNLSQRQADIAIRVTKFPPDTLIGKRVCAIQTTIYASKEYLKQQQNQQMTNLDWVMPNDDLGQLAANKWKSKHYLSGEIIMRSNTLIVLHQAVINNLGIAPLPCFLGDSNPKLQRLLPPPKALELELWLLIHPELKQTARVQAFKNFFMNTIQADINLLEGKLSN